ncbi:MAG: hypothetical protein M1820_003202 [Bogoriella megaspora]|nr:MAG: hypothetical protein M1820_003202 [Bogoriella megaspora]
MSTHVPDLPVEILILIFSFVKHAKTLLNVALSSKSYHEIVLPQLYSRVELYAGWEEPFSELRPLTCLLLSKPHVAKNVRQLALREPYDEILEDFVPPRSQADVEPEIRDAIAALAKDDEEKAQWMDDVSHDAHEDSVLSLMLPTLKNLTSLDLDFAMTPKYVCRQLGRVSEKERPFDQQMTLQNLESLLIGWIHPASRLRPEDIASIFLLPGLKYLYLHRFCSSTFWETAVEPLRSMTERSSPVTSIDMHDCNLSGSDIIGTLKVCKALSSFCYEMAIDDASNTGVDFPGLREALALHKESLQDLWLDIGPEDPEWDDQVDNTTPMKSFADFKALKRVKIALVYLSGIFSENEPENWANVLVEKLPPQIEHVQILRCQDGPEIVPKALEMLIVQKDGKFQGLQRLVIEMPRAQVDQNEDTFRRLVELAKSNGIDFTILNNHGKANMTHRRQLVERKWGFDENVEFLPCGSGRNVRPPFQLHKFQDEREDDDSEDDYSEDDDSEDDDISLTEVV